MGTEKRKKKDEPEEVSGEVSGGMVVQPHGGALHPGGVVGHVGNPNSPGLMPEHIRTHCRGSFAERIPILEAIADGEPLKFTKIVGDETLTGHISASIKERVSAIETLGKYGGVDKLALTADEQPEDVMTPERRLELLEQMRRLVRIEDKEKLLTAPKKGGE